MHPVIKRHEYIERRQANDRKLVEEWRFRYLAEQRAKKEGVTQGFIRGLVIGFVGAIVLIFTAAEVLWTFR